MIILPLSGAAQNVDLEEEEQNKMEFAGVFKSAINVEGFGKTGFVGISYDHLLSARWRVGVGVGYPGFGADLKFYPWKVKRFSPVFNLGLRSVAFFPKNGTAVALHSLPIGISYFGKSRINVELDIGPMFTVPLSAGAEIFGSSTNLPPIWFSVKIGHRFSFYAIKRARQLEKARN